MHYAEFAEDEVCRCLQACPRKIDRYWRCHCQSVALLAAIKDYEANKWKVIGQKLGKPAKVSLPGNVLTFKGVTNKRKGVRAVCERALWRESAVTTIPSMIFQDSIRDFSHLAWTLFCLWALLRWVSLRFCPSGRFNDALGERSTPAWDFCIRIVPTRLCG